MRREADEILDDRCVLLPKEPPPPDRAAAVLDRRGSVGVRGRRAAQDLATRSRGAGSGSASRHLRRPRRPDRSASSPGRPTARLPSGADHREEGRGRIPSGPSTRRFIAASASANRGSLRLREVLQPQCGVRGAVAERREDVEVGLKPDRPLPAVGGQDQHGTFGTSTRMGQRDAGGRRRRGESRERRARRRARRRACRPPPSGSRAPAARTTTTAKAARTRVRERFTSGLLRAWEVSVRRGGGDG